MMQASARAILMLAGLTTLILGSFFAAPLALALTQSPPRSAPQAPDAAPPGWPGFTLSRITSGFRSPVALANAADGSGRLFVVEQAGRIRILRDGAAVTTPFLDISSRVSCCGERGLLSVAFPPNYAAKGYFYVNYTDKQGDTVVARYRLTADPNVADPASEAVILTVKQPYANHNGGQLAFGPADGFLYIGMGDGGSAGDPQNRAQNPGELLGKLLRIDVESGTAPYAIPPGNPFVGAAGHRAEIWAVGFRNPWRFSFDTGTNDLYIGDVGQSGWEEVNFQPAASRGGENYGWRIMEGAACYNAAACNRAGLTPPVAAYPTGQGCAVTGGYVARWPRYPGLQGVYLYADYCTGRISGLRWGAAGWEGAELFKAGFSLSTFGQDEAGAIYVADYGGGVIHRIDDAMPPAPPPTPTPPPVATGNLPHRVALPVMLRRHSGGWRGEE
ncbi:MAG: PQQ-dependent sugar dehydrogenase [Chloroflexi bacterium]|nr:PQQ-dependent sugar dehydrogenase [Chloroflexota bacterium]